MTRLRPELRGLVPDNAFVQCLATLSAIELQSARDPELLVRMMRERMSRQLAHELLERDVDDIRTTERERYCSVEFDWRLVVFRADQFAEILNRAYDLGQTARQEYVMRLESGGASTRT